MLDEIRAEAFKYKVSTKTNESRVMMKTRPTGDDVEGGHVMMMEIPRQDEPAKTEVKVDISPILSKIDKMKKNIKH